MVPLIKYGNITLTIITIPLPLSSKTSWGHRSGEIPLNDLLCFSFVCCPEKVIELIDRPVVCLFGTRVSGTRPNVVT